MKSIRVIDVSENAHVEDILKLVQQAFGLKIDSNGRSETSIVLSYKGFDLKPKWTLADLSIPSGAIIRCIYRERLAAELYIHCAFNKQMLKLFDSTITIESTISLIRKKISDQLGLPLSTFCLEKHDGKHHLFDQMKLMSYDIKLHDHIYLKVWKGYEKFLSSCIRGYADHYSHDDLTRYYQAQIALHIAAFYGHMELATSVMQHGARCDRPVGEHPSRQWASETTTSILPEALKCPIHIAIERGHVKMVDLFVRHSIICTQIYDPITGYLPYKLALSCSLAAKSKQEKQCFREIYFYLHDKQYNLKIPLNANGDYVSSLLTSTTGSSAIHHRTSTHHISVSLALYCRIISWYEHAREKAWKKFGGNFYAFAHTKRVYPRKGLLGYKVLIDGYNNKFEAPAEQSRDIRSGGTIRSDKSDRYVGYSDEERGKLIQMRAFMKQFALDDRQRAKQTAATNLQQSRRPPLLSSRRTSTNGMKHLPVTTTAHLLEGISASPELSNSRIGSSLTALDLKLFHSVLDAENLSIHNNLLSNELTHPARTENHHSSKEKSKRRLKTLHTAPVIKTINQGDQRIVTSSMSLVSNVPAARSTITNTSESIVHTDKQAFQPVMSSVNAFLVSSAHIASEVEQRNAMKKRELFAQVEQTLPQQEQQVPEVSRPNSVNPLNHSVPVDRQSFPDVETHISLPDHPINIRAGPTKSPLDLKIRHATFQPYERYASASVRSTAINCLEEAGYCKRKSWLKQVEISKEMVKHRVQRRIGRADPNITKNSGLVPLRATHTTAPYKPNALNAN